jgi:ubiquinone/menaquinone biosynthesis C-methylase UbiE
MPKILKLLDEKILFPMRWKYLVRRLSPRLKNSKKVLDLGASCGRLASNLAKELPGTNFIGVDTFVQPKTYIPITKYDGEHIPFPNNSFDCVMIIDVLHHDNNPEKILKEAKRVSKKYILIKDHYWNNKIDLFLLKFSDYIGNKPYAVKLPYNFLKSTEWNDLIQNLNLEQVESEKFRFNVADPCKHVIFLLQKN